MQHRFSECDPGPWGSLRPLQGIHEVKTIFVIIPICYLPFSTLVLSHVFCGIFKKLSNT